MLDRVARVGMTAGAVAERRPRFARAGRAGPSVMPKWLRCCRRARMNPGRDTQRFGLVYARRFAACTRARGNGINTSGGEPVADFTNVGGSQEVCRSCSLRVRGAGEIGDVAPASRLRPGLCPCCGRGGRRSARCPRRSLFAGAASGWGGAVFLFVAGASAVTAAVPESLRLLSRELRLRRPLRPHLPSLLLLAGGGRVLSRRRGLLRRRRQPALRDVAVRVSVLVRCD